MLMNDRFKNLVEIILIRVENDFEYWLKAWLLKKWFD